MRSRQITLCYIAVVSATFSACGGASDVAVDGTAPGGGLSVADASDGGHAASTTDDGGGTDGSTSTSDSSADDSGGSSGDCVGECADGLRFEAFDDDPGWDALNNRVVVDPCAQRSHSFRYRDTAHAGGNAGEIGGRLERSTRRAAFWVPVDERTLDDMLVARGRLAIVGSDGGGSLHFGWFDEDSAGWRTPSSLVVRLSGDSGGAEVLFDYGTSKWRAGGSNTEVVVAADGSAHQWELTYDPNGAGGDGLLSLDLDGSVFEVPLDPGRKADGATFNRFGVMNLQVPGGAMEVYLDDLEFTGYAEAFDSDPGWIGITNDESFEDCELEDAHDYGWAESANAGGTPGELGGLVWRTEAALPEARTYVGDVVGPFSLDHELYARGSVAMTRATSDSGVLFGWFNATDSVGPEIPDFVGVMVEGPSREGHYFRPRYTDAEGEGADSKDLGPPHIYPDGGTHSFEIHYLPDGGGGGTLTATLDGQTTELAVSPEHVASGATLDRFGIVNYMQGGHHLELWIDDLAYTAE